MALFPQLQSCTKSNFLECICDVQTYWLDWLIYFNGMSTYLRIIYAYRLRNRIHCTFIFLFCFLSVFYSQSYQIRIIFKQINNQLIGPSHEMLFRIKVDLGIMAKKRYSRHPRSLEKEPHHQMQFSVTSKAHLDLRIIVCNWSIRPKSIVHQ